MIAILTTDPILFRMLTLEVKRGGIPLASPETAELWLLDLDHPPRPMPRGCEAYVIGFTAEENSRASTDHLLPLPSPTAALQDILRSYFHTGSDTALRHLPGIALVGERRVHLSPAEEALFSLLLAHRGETVPMQQLIDALPKSSSTTNVLQVHMYRLRRKLSFGGASYIRAVRGVGYRMT